MQYRVTYIHKVSQTCACKHTQYSHRRMLDVDKARHPGDAKWGEGPCAAGPPGSCPCKEFLLEFELHDLPDVIPAKHTQVATLLREHKLLPRGSQLDSARREGTKIVCFPKDSTWHAITLEPDSAQPLVSG
jgi:hypothetical protein